MIRYVTLLLALAQLRCAADGAVSVELLFVQKPSETNCSYTPDSRVAELGGRYDPTGSDGISLGISMQNHMSDESDDALNCPGSGPGCNPLANAATITAFEACWFREADGTQGPLTECEDLPRAQRRVLAGSGGAEPGLRGVGNLLGLTHEDLRGLYGPAFDPFAIPEQGPYAVDTNHSGAIDVEDTVYYSYGPEDPTSPSRSPAWGSFPGSQRDTVTLRLRAQVALATGRTLETNWLNYNVQVCIGCARDQCGPLQQYQCSERCNTAPCPFVEPGTAGTPITSLCLVSTPDQCMSHCPDAQNPLVTTDEECRPFDFLGPEVVLGQCRPFQFYSPAACIPVNRCLP